MKRTAILSLVCGVWSFAAISGQAAVIDFESLAHNDELVVDHGATYEEDGFLLTNTATVDSTGFPPSLATLGTAAYGYSGSTALFNDNDGGMTVLTRPDGAGFALESITLTALFPVEEVFDIAFVGQLDNTATVQQTFSLDGLKGAQTFLFDTTFTGLISVSWAQTGYYHQFDDLDVSPVPEPSTLLLLGTGLLGMAGAARKGARLRGDKTARTLQP